MFHPSRICSRILSFIIVVSACSCSPRIGTAEHFAQDHRRTENRQSVSTAINDCTRVEIRQRIVQDTFFRDSIVFKWRTKIQHDTILLRDSVLITDTVKVVQYIDGRTWIEKTTDKIGGISLLLIVLILIVQFLKFKRHD